MSKSRFWLALVLLGSIALVPVASWADAIHPDPPSICDYVAGNLVKNCGFETGDFSAWTVTSASGSSIHVLPIPHSGNFGAVFRAVGLSNDSISQVLSTTAGHAFVLSFFLEDVGSQARFGDFSASWDGKTLFSAPTTKLSFPFTQFAFVVPGHGTDTLQFTGRNPANGYALDDIVVTLVPEPGTLSLFGMGLLLGGALLARKKKAPQWSAPPLSTGLQTGSLVIGETLRSNVTQQFRAKEWQQMLEGETGRALCIRYRVSATL